MKNFYPSCSVGIIRAEYLLKVKVHFDSALTTSEEVSIPLDFSDVLMIIMIFLIKMKLKKLKNSKWIIMMNQIFLRLIIIKI